MRALGTILTPTGDTDLAISDRLLLGSRHFGARGSQLCNKRVHLALRLKRYYKTVAKTITFASGSWKMDSKNISAIHIFENRHLRAMAGFPKRGGETYVDYLHRTNGVIRSLMTRHAIPDLLSMVASNIHGWSGHASRLDTESPLTKVLAWRNVAWWNTMQEIGSQEDPRNRQAWRHKRQGRHRAWDQTLCELVGVTWSSQAQDKDHWRLSKGEFVKLWRSTCFSKSKSNSSAIKNRDEVVVHTAAPGILGDIGSLALQAEANLPLLALEDIPRRTWRLVFIGQSSAGTAAMNGKAHTRELVMLGVHQAAFKIQEMLIERGATPSEHGENFFVTRTNGHPYDAAGLAELIANSGKDLSGRVQRPPTSGNMTLRVEFGSFYSTESWKWASAVIVTLHTDNGDEFPVWHGGKCFGETSELLSELYAALLALRSVLWIWSEL